MNRLFDINSPILVFLGKVGDFLLLNLLWTICCIPIVTIVPSTAALYYVMLKIAKKEEPKIFKDFFHSFKDNLKQGVLLTLIFLVMGILLFFDYQLSFNMEGTISIVLQAIFFILGILYLMIVYYTSPLLSRFENPVKTTLKNAFLLSIAYLFRSILILFVNLFPLLVILVSMKFFIYVLPFWGMLFPSVCAFICAKQFNRIFDQLLAPKEEEATETPAC